MTAEELRRLAEIAGLKKYTVETNLGFIKNELYLNGDYFCCEEDWQPHLRIEQAMMVAEGMVKNDYWVSISYKTACFLEDINKPGWYVNFRNVAQKNPYDLSASADTSALAICRAALAVAKEV